jgi:hypothetical protein
MGANAQTAVPAFTAGQVLTAAQQTQINTGIPVFATTTTRDAAFGGTGEKTLAEGQFAYIEATNSTQYYDGSTWVDLGAVNVITAGSFTAASTVTADSVFTSTYRNYLIEIEGLSSVASAELRFQYRTSGTNNSNNSYIAGIVYGIQTAAVAGQYISNTYNSSAYAGTDRFGATFTIFAPQVAVATTHNVTFFGRSNTAGQYGAGGGIFNNTTQFDGIQFYPSSGTLTGTYRIYGLADA